MSHHLTFISLPGVHRAPWKAPVCLQTTGLEGLFPGAQSSKAGGEKSFCTAVCRPGSSPGITLCFFVFSQYKMVTWDRCWDPTSQMCSFPWLQSCFYLGFYTPRAFLLTVCCFWMRVISTKHCSLLVGGFSVLNCYSTYCSNEGNHLKFSIWIFRYH